MNRLVSDRYLLRKMWVRHSLVGEGSKSSSGSPSSLQGEGVRGWGSLQLFAPSQAIAKRCCEAQIADVVKWIQEKVQEE
jgi:hypothetical protein